MRGTVSMARTNDPNSANSQFFICFADAPWLDRQYTVWGQVVEGMEHVDAIKKGGEHNNGAISGAPDKIVKMQVKAASDWAKSVVSLNSFGGLHDAFGNIWCCRRTL